MENSGEKFAKPIQSSRGAPLISIADVWLDPCMEKEIERDKLIDRINAAHETALKKAVEEAKRKQAETDGLILRRLDANNTKYTLCREEEIREAEDRIWEEAAKIADELDAGYDDEQCCGPLRRDIASALRARKGKS